MTTVGSLFTGYGGLDMGVMTALDSSARIAWTSDINPACASLPPSGGPTPPTSGTSPASIGTRWNPWTSSAVAARARTSVSPGKRLLGNGVVPQQAALAVRTLTETALQYGAAQ